MLLMPCLSAQIWKMVSYTIAQKYTYAPTHVYLTKKAESIWIWCYQNRILSVHSRHSTRLYHKYTPQALYFFLFIICYFRFKFQTEITNLKNCFVRIVKNICIDIYQLNGCLFKRCLFSIVCVQVVPKKNYVIYIPKIDFFFQMKLSKMQWSKSKLYLGNLNKLCLFEPGIHEKSVTPIDLIKQMKYFRFFQFPNN